MSLKMNILSDSSCATTAMILCRSLACDFGNSDSIFKHLSVSKCRKVASSMSLDLSRVRANLILNSHKITLNNITIKNYNSKAAQNNSIIFIINKILWRFNSAQMWINILPLIITMHRCEYNVSSPDKVSFKVSDFNLNTCNVLSGRGVD